MIFSLAACGGAIVETKTESKPVYECSSCGAVAAKDTNFCSACGGQITLKQ